MNPRALFFFMILLGFAGLCVFVPGLGIAQHMRWARVQEFCLDACEWSGWLLCAGFVLEIAIELKEHLWG